MLLKRLIWGSLIIGLITLLFWWDHSTANNIGFTIIFTFVIGLSLYEFYKMHENIGVRLPKLFPIALIVSWSIANGIFSPLKYPEVLFSFDFILILFLAGAVIYYIFNNDISRTSDFFILTAGFVYVGLGFYYMYLIRYNDLLPADWGFYFLIYFVALNKLADTFAYFCGRLFGRTRLAPKISPKKTVEGLIGALVLGSVSGVFLLSLLHAEAFQRISWEYLILINFAIVAAGQLGDLLESMFKRHCRVKDSQSLVPALGGALDMVDSLLLSAPVTYYLILFGLS